MSTNLDKEGLRQYVRMWAANGPFLEDLRDQEIRQADTAISIQMFELAFRMALRDQPSRDSSGLVEWHDFMCRRQRHG